MTLSSYETHSFPDPRLPFIFCPSALLRQAEVETNWHKSIEILCCRQGRGYVRCGGQVFDFSEGDVVVVDSDTLHTVGSRETVDYICLIVDSAFCLDNGLDVEKLSFQNVIRSRELTDALHRLVLLHKSYDSAAICAVADYRYAVLGILRNLCREHCRLKNETSPNASGRYIKDAIVYIRKNLTQKLTLDAIAAHTGISKFHLAREFKTYTGSTIVEFINTVRCSEAIRLMENGASVSSAAYRCGFDNLSYFSRTFRKITGKNPSCFAGRSAK